jgi:predicted O-methyltransferase YrrM
VIRKITSLLRAFSWNPLWALHLFRNSLFKVLDRRDHTSRFLEGHYQGGALEEVLPDLVRISPREIGDLADRHATTFNHARHPSTPCPWNASRRLESLCYVVCRLTRPSCVVETGVAAGHTSRAILLALNENKHGRLYSIDLPLFSWRRTYPIGSSIPPSLRSRWHLTLGPSRLVLPNLLRRLGPIDVFVHDSDHTYLNQKVEFSLALSALRPGGFLIADDVGNDSIYEEAGSSPLRFLEQPDVPPETGHSRELV